MFLVPQVWVIFGFSPPRNVWSYSVLHVLNLMELSPILNSVNFNSDVSNGWPRKDLVFS